MSDVGCFIKYPRRRKMLDRLIKIRKDQRGFTLIELIMVIVILAILLALALPAYLGTRERAYLPEAQSHLQEMRTQAWLVYVEHGTFATPPGPAIAAPGNTLNWSFTWVSRTPTSAVMRATGLAGRTVAGNIVTLTLTADGRATIVTEGF
jgi:type IV pilus assembly protein PilA